METNLLRKSIAEFIGTYAIVFFGTGAICINMRPGVNLGLIGIALTFGLVVAVMVSSTGHISGAHFNPAVTAMCAATGRILVPTAIVYVVAQLAGATFASFTIKQIFGADAMTVHIGTPALAPELGAVGGLAIEFILTFFLLLVIFGTAIDARGHKLGGIAIGGVVVLDILVGGPLTGAAMNPARTFGPALMSGFWENHWIYWVGPIAGSLLAALLYEKVLAPTPTDQSPPSPQG